VNIFKETREKLKKIWKKILIEKEAIK